MFIIDWWNSLGIAVQTFYCIAIPATLFLLIETVLMFIGMGEGADGVDGGDGGDTLDTPDGDIDGSLDLPDGDEGIFGDNSISEAGDAWGLEGLRIFTVRGIISFFVVFGWVGAAMASAGIHMGITISVAFLCGFAVMVGIAFLLKAIMKLRNDGNKDNRNAVGSSGKVHLTIPPSRSGSGKVHLILQGSYVERDAVTDSEEAIPTGAEIVVIGVSGQTDLIVKLK